MRAVPGVVAVVRDGSFLGVVAETEAAAEAGLAALRKAAAWEPGDGLPDETKLAPGSRASRSRPPPSTSARPRAAPRCPHHPPPVLAPLHRACVDGAVVRDRAMERRRQGGGVVAQPGRLQPASRPVAGARAAAGEHRRTARRGCRLLRPQRRRRRRVRCGAAGARRAGPTRARAMVARGRARLVADGRRDGRRHRGRSRRAGRDRRLAPRGLEQRPRVAAGPGADPDRAGGLASGQAVRALHRLQSAAGQRRRRGAQRDPALRLSRAGRSRATAC